MKFKATYTTRPVKGLHSDFQSEETVINALDQEHAKTVITNNYHKNRGFGREVIKSSIKIQEA